MNTKNATQLKNEIAEIDGLIREALNHDFMPDKIYTKIITQIGAFDDAFEKAKFPTDDANFLNWVKLRLDKICEILITAQKNSTVALTIDKEDLMHPTGDYYNEDNSIKLSKEVKDGLIKVLEEKYS